MADKYIKKLADVLCGLIFDKRERDPEAYDTKATVRRIEDGKAYVHIPGGVDETPVDLTIDAKAGDTVQVRVSGGRAWLVGNRTAPPTDDTTARAAQGTAAKAEVRAEQAEETANSVNGIANSALAQAAAAKQIADDTEQHFWFKETGTDTGAHITEVPQDEWEDPSSPNYHSGGNLLGRSNGIAVREGMKELATMSQDGFDAKSYDSSDNEVVIAHLGYGPGTDSGGGTSDAPYYDLGVRTGTVGNYSVCEGQFNTASGYESHAEGGVNTASGSDSHCEGASNTAGGLAAHCEGGLNTASGDCSHCEGYSSEASGDFSHAGGYGTIADQPYQTAIGKYNTDNNTNNLFAIGNGTAGYARSNAFEVSNTGNVNIPSGAAYKINSTSIFDLMYPVGSIYMSVNSTNPGTLMAGTTWQRITGRFLLAATDGGSSGASQAAGNTGGAATVTLTAAQSGLPSHSHGIGSGQAFIRYNQTATGQGVQERSVASGASGNYKAPVVNSSSVDFSYVSTTGSEGGDNASSAHNNMPPYLSVYVWKRTA